MTPTLKFRDLNAVGRITIVAVALLTLGIAGVAFSLSYDALYDWATQQHLWSERANRLFPLLFEAAFIVAQGGSILAGIIRAALGGDREVHRGWPSVVMLLSGTLTIWFNVLHAGDGWSRRVAAALPPVLMILTFEIAISIVKWVMKLLGRPLDHTGGAPLLPPGYQTPYPGALPGAIYRPDVPPYAMPGSPFPGYGAGTFPPQGPFGQMPSPHEQRTTQIGHADGGDATKRGTVEMYLSGLTPEQLGTATRSSVAAELSARGVPIDETYAGRILGEYRAAHPANGNSTRKRK